MMYKFNPSYLREVLDVLDSSDFYLYNVDYEWWKNNHKLKVGFIIKP